MKRNIIFLMLIAFASVSCMRRWTPLMYADVISTKRGKVNAKRAKEKGEVTEEYCFSAGDEDKALTYKAGDATVGLVDEVVARAIKKKNAVAIKEANLEHSGACVRVTGIALGGK